MKRGGDVSNIVELSTFSAVVLESILIASTSHIRNRLLNLVEDPNKLTSDYASLVTTYSSVSDLVWHRNGDGIVVIPVQHVAWLCDDTHLIIIIDRPHVSYELPSFVDKHFERLFSAHSTSDIMNNVNVRVDNWRLFETNRNFVIETSRTTYYNSLVTNRAIDYELDKNLTVREMLECGPMLRPLASSLLSNHLGFNGFVESSDGRILFVKRNNNVSIGKRTYGNSIGASLKAKYALNSNFRFTVEGLVKGIVIEIYDELDVSEDDLIPWEDGDTSLGPIKLIAAYRDLLEGGKPQLLFFTRARLNSDSIQVAFNKKNSEIAAAESDSSRESRERSMETDGNDLTWIRTDELATCTIKPDRIVHNGKAMPMVPSVSACVAMLIDYLKYKRGAGSYAQPVLERFLKGKKQDQDACEDAIHSGQRFVAVIDGVTSKGTLSYDGKTSGRYAAEVIVDTFKKLERTKKELPPVDVLGELNDSLDHAMKEYAKLAKVEIGIKDYLRASVIYYGRKRKTVISYGDCQCRIGSAVHTHAKLIDEKLSQKRASVLMEYIANGSDVDELLINDPGRQAILPDLLNQFQYENVPGEYGYPVLNGQGICKEMIIEYPVEPGERVILCSDGYPQVCESLEESERYLCDVLKHDPLLFYRHPSTKGISPESLSYDDRAWVCL